MALLCSAYAFISAFLSRISTRRLAFILAVAASGLGWLLISSPAFSYPNVSPIEFWLSDGYLFFSLMAFPHYGWSIAALLMVFVVWRCYCEEPRGRILALLVALSMFHAFMQIFEIVVLDVVIALDALRRAIRDRRTLRASLVAGVSVVVVQGVMLAPYVWGVINNPLFEVWSQQQKTLSPPPHYYLLGYGLLLLFAVVGFVHAGRQKQWNLTFPALWLGAVAVLVYMPGGIQFRWLEGVQIPMAMLAAVGLERVAVPWSVARLPGRSLEKRRAWLISALLVIAMAPSTMYLISGNVLLAVNHWPEAFLTGEEAAGIAWLDGNSDPQDSVFSAYEIGNAIPARIGHLVFFGHWAETMYYSEKSVLISSFYDDMQDDVRRSVLREHGIRYVFFGPSESALGDFDPVSTPYLQMRFQDGEVAIFEVVHP
jgi:hypothetical protein